MPQRRFYSLQEQVGGLDLVVEAHYYPSHPGRLNPPDQAEKPTPPELDITRITIQGCPSVNLLDLFLLSKDTEWWQEFEQKLLDKAEELRLEALIDHEDRKSSYGD